MTATAKRILYVAMGILAGVATWAALELVLRFTPGYLVHAIVQGALIGMIFGYAIGCAEGIAINEPRKAAFAGVLGTAVGALVGGGAIVGVSAGLIAAANTFGADRASAIGLVLPASRIVAWGLVGAAIAAGDGVRTRSGRRIVAGGLGGLAGGLLGGAGLEALIRLVENPVLGRAAGFVILGCGIGFFLGEFERRFSYAKLRVLTGPLRNREYVLSRRRTVLGSSLGAQVYLRGYEGTEARHAEIVESGGDMLIVTAEKNVRVNEQAVHAERYLKYQDVIDLASVRLLVLPA
ncbi:MAG: hypothetical protein ACOC1U_06310 [Spirochaetota bacterium]